MHFLKKISYDLVVFEITSNLMHSTRCYLFFFLFIPTFVYFRKNTIQVKIENINHM